MNLGGLFVEIIGDPKQFNASLAGVRNSLTGFKAPSLNLGGLVSGAAATGAVKTAMDLEKSWSQVRKTTGLVGPDMDRLKASLEGLATTKAGVSLDEITQVAAMAGRLGIQGAEGITQYTDAISQIRIALDDIPAEEAATSLARLMNVFQLGPDSALSFASALNKLDDTSTATGRDILDVATRLSGTASTLGLSPQKTLALSAALKDAGVETEVAGTAFSQLFSKLASKPEKFAEVAGKSVEQFTASLRGDPLIALQEFIGGLKQFDSVSQFKVLDEIGLDGQRTAGSLLQLSKVIGNLNGMVASANSEWETHASITKEVGIQSETAYAQLTRMGNVARLMAADLGAIALPAIKGLANGVSAMSESIRSSTTDVRDALTGFASGLAEIFAPLASYIESWLSPVGAAVLAVVDTVLFAGRNFSDIFKLAQLDIADFVSFAVQRLVEFGGYLMTEWPNMLQDFANGSIAIFSNLAENIGNVMTEIYDYLSSMGNNPIEFKIKPVLEGFEGKTAAFNPAAFKSSYEGLRAELLKNIEDRESARMGVGAGAGADVAKKAEAEKPGMKAVPTEEEKRKAATFSDAASFAKQLQIGAFGKDEDAKKTAKNTDLLVKETRILVKTIKDKPANLGVAAI